MSIDASPIASPMVEHAPYIPRYGTPMSRRPNVEALTWSRRSPETHRSISRGSFSAFFMTRENVSLTSLLSAFSHDCSPQRSSSRTISNIPARGPSPSFFPAVEAAAVIYTGFSSFTVCLPSLLHIYIHPFMFNLHYLDGF